MRRSGWVCAAVASATVAAVAAAAPAPAPAPLHAALLALATLPGALLCGLLARRLVAARRPVRQPLPVAVRRARLDLVGLDVRGLDDRPDRMVGVALHPDPGTQALTEEPDR